MKIWVIGRGYPLPKNQLQGSFELEQAKMLARQGHDVTYLALVFHPFRKVRKWGMDSWRETGVAVRIFCAMSLPNRFRMRCKPYRTRLWMHVLRTAEQEQGLPDVIHVHYPSMICEPGALAAYQRRGVKLLSTEHWSQVLLERLSPGELARLRWYVENADGIAAVSQSLADAIQKLSHASREVAVIPNVVNPVFSPGREKPQDGVFRFITVGRLAALRQYDKVIAAFDDVFHGRTDVTLTLVGSGRECRKLERLICKRNARDNIFLAGIQTREECARMVAEADCLVCYSRYETFGVPVIEAWACGIPVIVSERLDFLRGSEGPELGVRVDPDQTDDLRRAMEAMAQKRHRYDPAWIAQYAQTHFSEDAVYQLIRSFYREAPSS